MLEHGAVAAHRGKRPPPSFAPADSPRMVHLYLLLREVEKVVLRWRPHGKDEPFEWLNELWYYWYQFKYEADGKLSPMMLLMVLKIIERKSHDADVVAIVRTTRAVVTEVANGG